MRPPITRRRSQDHARRTSRILGTLLVLASAAGPGHAAGQAERSITDQYVVYFISSTFCVANQQAGFHDAVRAMIASVRARAEAENRTLIVAGVSVDTDAGEGIRYLEKFGEFDEIVSGANWLNTAMVDLIWRERLGPPTIPQVIVVRRQLDRSNPRTITIGDDVPVVQLAGADALHEWVLAGTPLHEGTLPGENP